MENKMTKREVINMMLADEAIGGNEIYVKYLTRELEILDNKKASKKPSKNQLANVETKKAILELLADGVARTATEVGLAVGISQNSATALLGQLGGSVKTKTEDKVKRVQEGKKVTFTLA